MTHERKPHHLRIQHQHLGAFIAKPHYLDIILKLTWTESEIILFHSRGCAGVCTNKVRKRRGARSPSPSFLDAFLCSFSPYSEYCDIKINKFRSILNYKQTVWHYRNFKTWVLSDCFSSCGLLSLTWIAKDWQREKYLLPQTQHPIAHQKKLSFKIFQGCAINLAYQASQSIPEPIRWRDHLALKIYRR